MKVITAGKIVYGFNKNKQKALFLETGECPEVLKYIENYVLLLPKNVQGIYDFDKSWMTQCAESVFANVGITNSASDKKTILNNDLIQSNLKNDERFTNRLTNTKIAKNNNMPVESIVGGAQFILLQEKTNHLFIGGASKTFGKDINFLEESIPHSVDYLCNILEVTEMQIFIVE